MGLCNEREGISMRGEGWGEETVRLELTGTLGETRHSLIS